MTLALLFPGQGAQFVGMGRELASISASARDLFSQSSEILGYDLLKLCVEGPDHQLHQTQHSQPALFVHSLAALEQFCDQRPNLWDSVSAVAGLSLGEYTAIVAAGGLNFADGLRLVQLRGLAMQTSAESVESGMSSILGLSVEKVEAVCKRATSGADCFVEPANLLCPGNIAISGHTDALSRAENLAMEAGALKAVRLPVAGAFHTSIMQPAVPALQAALDAANFMPTRVPVYSNVDAQPHSEPEQFRSLLSQQITSPVLWENTISGLLGHEIDRFIEIGAGRVLAGTVKRVNRKTPCENYGDKL